MRIREWFRLLPDVLTVTVGVALIAILAQRYLVPIPHEARPLPEVRISATLGIDFDASAQTLIVAVQEDCPACAESMPFYRRVIDSVTDDVQIAFAALGRSSTINEYLASHDVEPDVLVRPEWSELPVAGTPTLLVVDDGGLVTHAWIGVLDVEAEADVLRVLLG